MLSMNAFSKIPTRKKLMARAEYAAYSCDIELFNENQLESWSAEVVKVLEKVLAQELPNFSVG
jgi:hypothetical protein